MSKNKTITSVFIIGLILINAVLRIFGVEPVDIDYTGAYDFISGIFLIASTVWAMWKNHNFTPEALSAQKLLDALKKGYIDYKEVERWLEDKEVDDEC